MTRRDRMLAQMGITQWTLRQPQRLKGELSVQIPASARLLIITDEQTDLTCDLFSDIFRCLNITADDVYCIAPENIQSIPGQTSCLCWLPGVDADLPDTLPLLHTPSLANLYQDVQAKRGLWTQIYQHDQNITAAS
ncbi:MAG TPA: DNA polymerase III subunit psi [Morganella sp. (in: Bacteria)]|nr:DNA polymerase III subunit psi [Morganella sp. (in: enterobacteria)]